MHYAVHVHNLYMYPYTRAVPRNKAAYDYTITIKASKTLSYNDSYNTVSHHIDINITNCVIPFSDHLTYSSMVSARNSIQIIPHLSHILGIIQLSNPVKAFQNIQLYLKLSYNRSQLQKPSNPLILKLFPRIHTFT